MKVVAIHQPQFLPYLGLFHKLAHADVFVALDNVQFIRTGFQHRNRFKSSQGELLVTVPVKHQFRPMISEVQIDNQISWQRKLWNTLTANYARAPHFNRYAPELKNLLERDWQNLAALDDALLRWAMAALEIETPIVNASDLAATGAQSELLANICREVGADAYLSGPGGKNYMEMEVFDAAGVRVIWQEYAPVEYEQLFPKLGFLPNLSVVDALFCCGGANARRLIESNGAAAA